MPKEALHVLIGITNDGKKEAIDYTLFPTKSISIYNSRLTSMKEPSIRFSCSIYIYTSKQVKQLAS